MRDNKYIKRLHKTINPNWEVTFSKPNVAWLGDQASATIKASFIERKGVSMKGLLCKHLQSSSLSVHGLVNSHLGWTKTDNILTQRRVSQFVIDPSIKSPTNCMQNQITANVGAIIKHNCSSSWPPLYTDSAKLHVLGLLQICKCHWRFLLCTVEPIT